MTPEILQKAPLADVHAALRADRGRVSDLIARAFADDPPSRWIFPDPVRFADCFRRFVEAFAGPAFEMGTAYWIGRRQGAALWLPPGAHGDEDALAALFDDATPAERRAGANALFEQMDSYHPDEPHWHLALIGVEPAMRGRGLGSKLLAETLAMCDRAGQPAYLEATSPLNVALYERHGFEAMGEIQAGTSPVIVPMLRRPR